MRFWVTLVATVLTISLGAWGQAQPPALRTAKPLKAKPSSEFKVNNESKPAPNATIGRASGTTSAKSLQDIERETPKGNSKGSSRRASAPVPQEKEKPAPKINFKAASAQKKGSASRPAADPFKGRLKQKGQQ